LGAIGQEQCLEALRRHLEDGVKEVKEAPMVGWMARQDFLCSDVCRSSVLAGVHFKAVLVPLTVCISCQRYQAKFLSIKIAVCHAA